MCKHCVEHVKEAISNVKGVYKVEVSLENKTATVYSNIDIRDKDIVKAVKRAGYKVK